MRLADQSAKVDARSTNTAKPATHLETTTISTSDYVPAFGDVVEFEYGGRDREGIVFNHKSLGIGVAASTTWFCHMSSLNLKLKCNCGLMEGVSSETKAISIAKAYFAAPAAIKVGDRVEYCWFGEWKPAKVSRVNPSDCMPYYVGDSRQVSDENIRPAKAPTFTGDYAQRQKQWIDYHGLKVGDKVKVVRKFEENEDDYMGGSWYKEKADYIGKVVVINSIEEDTLALATGAGDCWPYFALEPVK